jgi:glycosyltransferase involved in cell wall biosynthesis
MASLLVSLDSVLPSETCDVLIVDDGSPTQPVVEAQARRAWRAHGTLQVLRQPVNGGIERALNAGLDWIERRNYTYVARLDCGDRNVGQRIAIQERFLDEHPEVLLVGGAALFVDPQGVPQFTRRLPTTPAGIASLMRSNSAFMHPAVMFRVSALPLVGRYPLDYPAAEDYAYFWRFMQAGPVANLPDVLIEYELDPGSISLANRHTQLTSRLAIQREHDDGSWRARLGILRTRILRHLPYSLAFRAKKALNRHGSTSQD